MMRLGKYKRPPKWLFMDEIYEGYLKVEDQSSFNIWWCVSNPKLLASMILFMNI